jgi:hypothetical protein
VGASWVLLLLLTALTTPFWSHGGDTQAAYETCLERLHPGRERARDLRAEDNGRAIVISTPAAAGCVLQELRAPLSLRRDILGFNPLRGSRSAEWEAQCPPRAIRSRATIPCPRGSYVATWTRWADGSIDMRVEQG